jgi:hypothetical protein
MTHTLCIIITNHVYCVLGADFVWRGGRALAMHLGPQGSMLAAALHERQLDQARQYTYSGGSAWVWLGPARAVCLQQHYLNICDTACTGYDSLALQSLCVEPCTLWPDSRVVGVLCATCAGVLGPTLCSSPLRDPALGCAGAGTSRSDSRYGCCRWRNMGNLTQFLSQG